MRAFLVIVLFLFSSTLVKSQYRKLDSLKHQIAILKPDTNKAKTYFKIGEHLYKGFDTSESIVLTYFDSGIYLSKKLQYYNGFIKGSLVAANYSRIYGEYAVSLNYLQTVYDQAIVKKDTSTLIDVFIRRGACFISQGLFTLAADNYFKGIELAELAKDKGKLSRIYNGLGNLYMEQSICRNAIFYHTKALNLRTELAESLAISHSYINLGISHTKCSNYDSSIYFFKKALQIQTIKKNVVGQAYSYDGIGNNYLLKKQFGVALSYFQRAYKIIATADEVEEKIECYMGLGKTYFQMNKNDSALKYFLMTKDIVEAINKLNGKQTVYENLSDYYEKTGDFKEALKYNKLSFIYRDSIFGSENAKNITSLEYNRQIAQAGKIKELEEQQNLLIHESEISKQKNIISYFIIGLVALMIIAFYMYKGYKQKSDANKIITAQKEEVERKSELIEEKQKEILDSIHYAKRIQTTLLAHKDFIDANIRQNFVFFEPKDIVSGDFYWATKHDDLFYLAVCDSTGHGVPGAFMSLISISFLNEAINEKNILKPNEVFNYVREKLIRYISKDGQKDGFDGILLCLNTKTAEITYAAANNAPLIVSNGMYKELPSDRMPVGHGVREEEFSLHNIELKKEDVLYLYTDGYADQFGGPKGKKFLYKRLNEYLVALSGKKFNDQADELAMNFDTWKGDLEQVDDVCIIGIRL